jgi:hypothetical protein
MGGFGTLVQAGCVSILFGSLSLVAAGCKAALSVAATRLRSLPLDAPRDSSPVVGASPDT